MPRGRLRVWLVTPCRTARRGHETGTRGRSDTLSQITDQNDRSHCRALGDGAVPFVVGGHKGDPLILAATISGLDGSLTPILYCDKGGFIVMEFAKGLP